MGGAVRAAGAKSALDALEDVGEDVGDGKTSGTKTSGTGIDILINCSGLPCLGIWKKGRSA